MSTRTLCLIFFLPLLSMPFTYVSADPAYNSYLDINHEIPDVVSYFKKDNSNLIRWKVGKNSFLGQTIVNGKTMLGLEFGDGAYVYSIDHQSLSLTIRF